MSLNPILFTQVPAIDTVLTKLSSFIDTAPTWPSGTQSQAKVKQILAGTVAPYLKARFVATPTSKLPSASPALLTAWSQSTSTLAAALPIASLFPLVDLWRLALLDPSISAWATPTAPSDPLFLFLDKAAAALRTPDAATNPRNYLLTVLRLLANAFSSPALAQKLFLSARTAVAAVLVPSLLHTDGAVRTAAASLAFNAAAFVQKGRVEKVRGGAAQVYEDEDWEVEMVSAVVEAIDRETASEEVGMCFSFGFLYRVFGLLTCAVCISSSPDCVLGVPRPLVAVL